MADQIDEAELRMLRADAEWHRDSAGHERFVVSIATLLDVLDKLAAQAAEIDAERLRYGQERARNAVFMQAMASFARNGFQEAVPTWIRAADAAAANVRLEDFVTAKMK